jgi:hypothetical protein
MFLQLKARTGYWLARRLFHWSWFVRQPRGWRWLEGQFARMANLGNVGAQSFYGHILTFRGVVQTLAAFDHGQVRRADAYRAGQRLDGDALPLAQTA